METSQSNELVISYSQTDQVFYVFRNGEEIHYQKTKPTNYELTTALLSDEWDHVFKMIKSGYKVRVSERIYWEMMGSVPPIKQTATSFYCGEAYSGTKYYYFEKVDGFCYGQLKELMQ